MASLSAALAVMPRGAAAGELRFTQAVARWGCTQEDIPAMEILLTTEKWKEGEVLPTPYIRIEAAGIAKGKRIGVRLSPLRRDPAQRELARAELHFDGKSVTWLSGSLHVFQNGDAEMVRGDYRFCADDAKCFDGTFTAPWHRGPARCG